MTISAALVAPSEALGALASTIAEAKGTDALAPVTVAVPTNTCGVMTRRALGRAGGIAAVDMVTLNRLAELIGGPELAAAGRSPMSTPVVDLAVGAVLTADPGPFGPVATHPSTVVALRELHAELRLAGPAARGRLAEQSSRGRHVLRVSDAVTERLEASWYDEADLYAVATAAVRRAVPDGLRSLVLHLPQELSGLALDFVRALGEVIEVRLVLQVTGDASADADTDTILDALGLARPAHDVTIDPRPTAIVSTTDADDEVRTAVRSVVDAARAGTPFERIAVLWPAQRPYARLVEHHLTNADIPWNGRPGTTVTERLAPRLVLDLLDVDRRGLRRRNLFDLLADVPARDADGDYLPTASWERVSREAGVSRDDDWDRRLGSIAGYERWAAPATSLRTFVTELRAELGHPASKRAWSDWSTWCNVQVDRWLGRHTIERLPEAEYRAWESLTTALDRLGHLDPVGEPVTRHRFRSTLEAELDASPAREGRVGNGVTVGPLAGAVGLDVDMVVIVGAAEGILPPTPRSDPLLSEADRALAGLPTSDARAIRLHRLLLATLATSSVTLTHPRGDLRATSQLLPSRWIGPWIDDLGVAEVASHHAGLEATEFPATPAEHRLRRRYQHVRSGRPIDDADSDAPDAVLRRGLICVARRGADELTVYDGDLSGVDVPRLDGPVSPSRLESWVACPHAYFAHYLLEVDPIEEPDDEISITALRPRLGSPQRPRPVPPRRGRWHAAPTHRDGMDRRAPRRAQRRVRRGVRAHPAPRPHGTAGVLGRRTRPHACRSLDVARTRQRPGARTRIDRARLGDALRRRRRRRDPSTRRPRHPSCRVRSTASTEHVTGPSWSPITRRAARRSSRTCRPTIPRPVARCSSCRAMRLRLAPASAATTRSCTPSTD